MRLIVKPEEFAVWFNRVMPGDPRQITDDDVQDMTSCGPIGKYGFYGNLGLEMVRAILQYEQLHQNRQKRDEIRYDDGVVRCRRCGVVLAKSDGKRGRPREYCTDCESSRATMRGRKWRRKMKAAMNSTVPLKVTLCAPGKTELPLVCTLL